MISGVSSNGATQSLWDLMALQRDQPAAASSDSTSAAGATSAAPAVSGSRRGLPPEVASAAASALGMSPTDLATALKSGSTLADLATQHGVSRDQLLAAVTSGMQAAGANRPGGAPALSADQLSKFAADVIDGTAPASGSGRPHGHGHHHHVSVDAANSSADPTSAAVATTQQAFRSGSAATDLSSLSAKLGTSVDSLLGQLRSGNNLAGIGAAAGVSNGDAVSSLLSGSVVDSVA